MASMGCIVALPDKALFQGEITYANIPGTDGYFGVLPGHELTVSLNREGGVVTLTIGENEKREFLVMGGATSVLDDKVTVLARFGTAVEDIDAEAVRAEAAECKSAIAELEQKNDPQDQATLMTHQKKLEWCEAQLAHVAQPSQEREPRHAQPQILSLFREAPTPGVSRRLNAKPISLHVRRTKSTSLHAQRLFPALAGIMDTLRYGFLAGTVRTKNQYGNVKWSDRTS